MLAATYLGASFAFFIPLVVMLVSDLIIGNTNIFIFTWSAFIFIGVVNYRYLQKIHRPVREKLVFAQTIYGLGATLFFYLYTNFGVWWLDAWQMYPNNLKGLLQSYLMGLPFLRLHLIGNIIYVPVVFSLVEVVKAVIKEKWLNLSVFKN